MAYAQALEKAWDDVLNSAGERNFSVKLLSDVYDIDVNKKQILSESCNIPAKEHISIIILHYLIQKLKTGIVPAPGGEWIDFNQLEGGDGYYPAFKKRTIDRILKKYGKRPDGLLKAAGRFPASRVDIGDVGIVISTFENVPILITMSKGDEEFEPAANIVFDKTISQIMCTEDIIVLTEFIVHSL